jgi:hypothetical protein
MNRFLLEQAIKKGNIEWQRHALERMMARGISRKTEVEVVLTGQMIEEYPREKPYPSALILGWSKEEPFHVVTAFNELGGTCYIITAYRPDKVHFESDFKTRRNRG